MMDQTIFLVPASILVFLVVIPLKNNWRKIAALILPILIISVIRALRTKYFPTVAAAVPSDISWSLFLNRFSLFPNYTFSFSHTIGGRVIDWQYLWITYAIIVAIGSFYADKRQRVLICLGVAWIVCSTFVFLTISRYFPPHSLHITGFGVSFSFVISVWVILRRSRIKQYNVVFSLLFFMLLFYSGISRMQVMGDFIESRNQLFNSASPYLKSFQFPANAQILVANVPAYHTGVIGNTQVDF